jgi:pSer/pThr/pTyr-binding forkhead associated (FHA) protein
VRVDDSCVSRRHAEVRLERGRWWLVDLGSRNGTRLDDRFVQRAPLLRAGTVRLYDAGPELRLEPSGTSATTILSADAGIDQAVRDGR